MGGFVESPRTEELSALARAEKIPFVEDLGSGAVATERFAAIEHEPTPAEVLRCGVDLVCFSGDKLLGGPQAGLIAGSEKLVKSLKKEPFFRALRWDKLILSALQTTVDAYLGAPGTGSARTDSNEQRAGLVPGTPILEMLQISNDALRARAQKIIASLAGLPVKAKVGEGRAQLGGGTLPKSAIPSVTMDLLPTKIPLADFAARLHTGAPPVIGYISGDRFKLDLRTIFPRQDEEVIRAISSLFQNGQS